MLRRSPEPVGGRAWPPPGQDELVVYSFVGHLGDVELYSCGTCGATVALWRKGLHSEWHDKLAPLLREQEIG